MCKEYLHAIIHLITNVRCILILVIRLSTDRHGIFPMQNACCAKQTK